MDLEGIISVSGKPGLYKVVSKKKSGLVVESIPDGKKLNIFALDKVSALDDISIYTYEDDIPLKDVYIKLYQIEEGAESVNHKDDATTLRDKMVQILPDFDQDRVYTSDLKKLFQWYNLLIGANMLSHVEEKEDSKEKEDSNKKEESNKKEADKE